MKTRLYNIFIFDLRRIILICFLFLSIYTIAKTNNVRQFIDKDTISKINYVELSNQCLYKKDFNNVIHYCQQGLRVKNDTIKIPLFINMAEAYKGLSNYDNSIQIYKDLLKEKDSTYLWIIANNISKCYYWKNDFNNAIHYIQLALSEIEKNNGTDLQYAKVLTSLATYYNANNQLKEAINTQKKAIRIKKNIKDTSLPISLWNLHTYYVENKDSIKALQTATELVKADPTLQDFNTEEALNFVYALSIQYENKNVEKAIYYAILAKTIYKERFKMNIITGDVKPYKNYLNYLQHIINLYIKKGDYNKAIIEQEILLKQIHDKETAQYATALAVLAEYHYLNRNYSTAIDIQKRVLELRKKIDGSNSSSYFRTLYNICQGYYHIGNLESPMNICKEIENYAKLNNNDNLLTVNIYKIAIYDSNPQHIINNIAKCVSNLPKLEKYCSKLQGTYFEATNIIAELYERVANFTEASKYNAITLNGIEELYGTLDKRYLGACSKLCHNYYKMQELPKVDSLYSIMIPISKQMNNKKEYYISTYNQLLCKSKIHKNQDYSDSLQTVAAQIFNLEADSTNYATLSFNIGLNLIESKKYKEAISLLQKVLSIQEKNKIEIVEIIKSLQALCYACTLQQKNISPYINKLLTIQKHILQYYNNMTESDRHRLFNYMNEMINPKFIFNNYNTPNSIIYNYLLLSKEILLLIDKTKGTYKKLDKYTQITWEEIQKNLYTSDVCIEFVIYNSFPFSEETFSFDAFIIRRGWSEPRRIHLFNTNKKNFLSIYSALSKNNKHTYQLIWQPIEKFINPSDHVYFCASDILHRIPIESLPVGNGKIMSDIYHMHRLSSTRELALKKDPTKYKKAALYGGLNYDMTDSDMKNESSKYQKEDNTDILSASRGLLEDSTRGYKWVQLGNTRKEVEYIKELLEKSHITANIFKGNSGNEESFKALSGQEYNIIHLATHGFFYPNEVAKKKDYFKPILMQDELNISPTDMSLWRSGLVLSGGNRAWKGDSIPEEVEDGILKSQEIKDLDLRGADLVVLSACHTGQGEVTDEGVFGLQRAFKMAGVQTIVMSLTEADDQTTMAMMNKFYTNLLSGQSKHDAFYNAQRYIRSIKPDPIYWAGWIMLD